MRVHLFLLSYLLAWSPLAYAIIFLGAVLEGDITVFSAFFLAYHGFLSPWIVIVVAFLGCVLGDICWYWLGYYAEKKLPRLAHWAEKITRRFDDHLREHPIRTIFISKFTYGLNHATLMRSAMLRIPLYEVLESDIPAIVLWITIVGSLGYFSGLSYDHIREYFRFLEVALLISVALFILLEYLISMKSKNRL